MPGPGGGLLSMMEGEPQQQLNPLLSSLGEQAPPYYGGGGGPGVGMFSGSGSIPQSLAQYFDQSGQARIDDPRQVAAQAGIGLGQLAGGFFPRYGDTGIEYNVPSDQGGFFSIQDLFRLSGTPSLAPSMGPQRPGGERANMGVYREGARDVPASATFNQQMPSTNNWRLLGMGPGWILRNGSLINTLDSAVRAGLPGGASNANPAAAEHGSQPVSVGLGTGGGGGFPSWWTPSGMSGSYYWPGAVTGGIPRWGSQMA